MADFPPINGLPREHSKYHKIEYEDPNISAEMEGGYRILRARNSRTARRIITTGYELLTQDEMQVLNNFQLGRNLTALSFTYALPTTGEIVVVRFVEPIRFNYIGLSFRKLWRVEPIRMREI